MVTGGIELGGIKIVDDIGDEDGLIECRSIPITSPSTILSHIKQYFQEKQVKMLGIETFGSVDLNQGIITTTPKPGWSGVNLKEWLEGFEVEIDTDVNGVCLGEVAYGAGRSKHSVVYGTISTGIN